MNLLEWLLAETHIYYKHTLTHCLRYCNLGRFHTESDDFSSSLLPSRQLSCSYLLFPLAPDLSSCSTTVYEHLFPLTFLAFFYRLPARIEELLTNVNVRTYVFTTYKVLQNSRSSLTIAHLSVIFNTAIIKNSNWFVIFQNNSAFSEIFL